MAITKCIGNWLDTKTNARASQHPSTTHSLTDSFVLLVLVLLLPPGEEARLAAAHLAPNEQADQGADLFPRWVASAARSEGATLIGFRSGRA